MRHAWQSAQPNTGVRDAWRLGRRLNQSATFRPGEELRCPGTLRLLGHGPLVCAGSFSEYAKPHTRVIIRVRSAQVPDLPHAGTNLRCHKCGTSLEKLTILEASQ